MSNYRFKKKVLGLLPVRLICFLKSIQSRGALSLGKGSFVHSSVHLIGRKNIVVGDNSCISEGGWLNVNHRESNEPSIIIGNNCFVGKNNFFSSGSRISIGDYTLTAIDCKFMGSSHVIADPFVPYLSTGTTDDSVIDIGTNCFLGAGVSVLGDVRIGYGSVIGAGSHVAQDVPPFSIVIGNPGRVVKRFSFPKKQWIPVDDITEEDLACMPVADAYLSKIKIKYPAVTMPWIAAGRSMGNL